MVHKCKGEQFPRNSFPGTVFQCSANTNETVEISVSKIVAMSYQLESCAGDPNQVLIGMLSVLARGM